MFAPRDFNRLKQKRKQSDNINWPMSERKVCMCVRARANTQASTVAILRSSTISSAHRRAPLINSDQLLRCLRSRACASELRAPVELVAGHPNCRRIPIACICTRTLAQSAPTIAPAGKSQHTKEKRKKVWPSRPARSSQTAPRPPPAPARPLRPSRAQASAHQAASSRRSTNFT